MNTKTREERLRDELVGRVDDLWADEFETLERVAAEQVELGGQPKAKVYVGLEWDVAVAKPRVRVRLSYSQTTRREMEAELDFDQARLWPEGED